MLEKSSLLLNNEYGLELNLIIGALDANLIGVGCIKNSQLINLFTVGKSYTVFTFLIHRAHRLSPHTKENRIKPQAFEICSHMFCFIVKIRPAT